MAKKILVIDDDRSTVKFLAILLGENGYEVVTACDGREGLERIREIRPDLLILDVMMPKKSGFTLFKQIKNTEDLKEIPVLMLTGVAGILENDEKNADAFEKPFDSLKEALRKTVREMRADGLVRPDMFMDKPIDPEPFIEKVRDLIGC